MKARSLRKPKVASFEEILDAGERKKDVVGKQSGRTRTSSPSSQAVELEKLKTADRAWRRRRLREIEEELKALRQKRKEELRRRRQKPLSPPQEEEKRTLVLPPSKPRQLPGFWGRRIKTAAQKARPEMIGRRRGG